MDTSFFGEYAKYDKEFAKLLNNLKVNGTKIITLKAVKTEFGMAARDKQKLDEYYELVDEIVDKLIDETVFLKLCAENKALEFYFKNITKLKGNTLKNVSYVDLMLATALMIYKGEVFLTTKNFNDFPFNIEGHIALYKNNKIESYAIYSCPTSITKVN